MHDVCVGLSHKTRLLVSVFDETWKNMVKEDFSLAILQMYNFTSKFLFLFCTLLDKLPNISATYLLLSTLILIQWFEQLREPRIWIEYAMQLQYELQYFPALPRQQTLYGRERRPQRWPHEHVEEDLWRWRWWDEENYQQSLDRVARQEEKRGWYDGLLNISHFFLQCDQIRALKIKSAWPKYEKVELMSLESIIQSFNKLILVLYDLMPVMSSNKLILLYCKEKLRPADGALHSVIGHYCSFKIFQHSRSKLWVV